MAAVAVKVLVVEPIWKSVSPSTGRGFSRLVTPNPATCSWPSANTPPPRHAGHAQPVHLLLNTCVQSPEAPRQLVVAGRGGYRDVSLECHDSPSSMLTQPTWVGPPCVAPPGTVAVHIALPPSSRDPSL